MSGPQDKFERGELDELEHDFELDMDAPIGASFAAALRDPDGSLPPLEESEFGMDDADALPLPGWNFAGHGVGALNSKH